MSIKNIRKTTTQNSILFFLLMFNDEMLSLWMLKCKYCPHLCRV